MKISGLFFTVVSLFVIWMLLTGSTAPDELVTGLLSSVVIALFTGPLFSRRGMSHLKPSNLFRRFKFLLVFLRELVKANVDVAIRVLSPSLPINR